MDTKVIEPVNASDITDSTQGALEALAGVKKFGDPMKDPHVAAIMRKWIKEQKGRLPKHENYKPCRKNCPMFKKCECFKKTSVEQMACYEKLGKIYDMPESAGMSCGQAREGYSPSCHACSDWKKCVVEVMSKGKNNEEVKG